jgi:glycosyltransferase involved in cell wall biosynthesis
MGSPKYSIVIPTRERAHTLRYCLQTCLNVDYADYEIIVGDNHSSEETYQVVRQLNSPRIKYYRTDQPLSMSSNWELALAHTTGEWVTFIGDDDCILPHAYRQLDRILPQLSVRLVRCDSGLYFWPNPDVPALSNYLQIPLSRAITIHNSAEVIKRVITFQYDIGYLPSFYHGAVHRSLIDEVLRVSKTVFVGHYPDHFPGYAFAYLAKQYAQLGFPITFCGHAPKSNGATGWRTGKGASAEFFSLNETDGLAMHPWIPANQMVDPITYTFDPFLLAKERFFPRDDRLKVDRKDYVTKVSQYYSCYRHEEWELAKRAIRANLQDDPVLQTWFDHFITFELDTTARVSHSTPALKSRGVVGDKLHLDAGEFGITDIAGAASFCDQILCLRNNPVDFVDTRPAPPGRLDRVGLPRPLVRAIRGILSAIGKKY